MKLIDVITLSESTTYVMYLANKNGAIDSYVSSSDDNDHQNIHIKVPDNKHQAVFEAIQTYLDSSSTSSVETRQAQDKSSPNNKLDTEINVKKPTQIDLNLFSILLILIFIVFIIIFQMYDDAFLFLESLF